MIVAHTRAELTAALEQVRYPRFSSGLPSGGPSPGRQEQLAAPFVLVPTMGALHDGHRALLRRARELAGPRGTVAVSIFVNSLQFGPNEDLDKYPRTPAADLAVCEEERADLVFAPSAREMYPQEQRIMVDPGPAGEILEGEFRPGFFRGVLTVVLKLLCLVRPDIAVFGQKDAQQLVLVRAMVADFALAARIEAVPTVRAADGLALSSRNKYLSSAERTVAPVLHRALSAGAVNASGGPRAVLAAAQAVLDEAASSSPAGTSPRVDYLALVDARSYRPVRDDKDFDRDDKDFDFVGTAVLAIAARVGTTRLIDNVIVQLSPGGTTPRTPRGTSDGEAKISDVQGVEQHAAGD